MFGKRRKKGSSNPMFSDRMMNQASQQPLDSDFMQVKAERMTVQGAVNKSFILGAILVLTACIAYSMPNPLFIWGGAIGGLVIVLVAVWKPHLSPTLAPIYAGVEGLFVGGISAMYALTAFPGIIFQAVISTIAVFFMMLFVYKSGLIKVTNKLRTGIMMATGAIFVVYILSWGLSMFGMQVPYLHEGGAIGIGISLLIIGVAAFNLLLDFDNFDRGEKAGAPAYMEWFFAMGLLITLVWLYVEILRLLAIFSSSD